MASPTGKQLSVPLPVELRARLEAQAEAQGRPASELAREAITEWLERHRRADVGERIRAYAKEVAGSEDDLDEDLETASLEQLAGVED